MASSKLIVITILIVISSTAFSISPLQIEPRAVHTKFKKHLGQKSVESVKPFATQGYRLPRSVNPISYRVQLMPILKDVPNYQKFTAPGEVTIQMESIMNSDSLCLHQKNLSIDEASVKLWRLNSQGSHDMEILITNQSFDLEKDFYCLNVSTPFILGEKYDLYIKFVADVSQTDVYGLYLGHYTEPTSGEVRYLAATHFQPTNTRAAFPCFDEPDMKATFEIILGRHRDFHSLANMDLNVTTPHNETDWVWDHYNPTVKMSAYLVAFVISDFGEEVADPSFYGKPVKVWAAQYLIDQKSTTFAGEAAAKSLQLFDSLFDIKYFMPKMDSVALPQFSSAMENTGLNLYRYSLFLYTPVESTEEDRKLVNLVVGHEVSHQWFGDLVTCNWWDETWLNEGFARFLQYWSMRSVTPEFNPDVIIISDVVHEALSFDQGVNTHPLKHQVGSPEEVELIFDEISYDKGSSLLRMLESSILTPEIFLQGLQIYLSNRQYESAEQTHLFTALNSVGNFLLPTNVTLEDIMNTWTLQSGFPIVRVTKADANKIYLSQEKFTPNSDTQSVNDGDGSWYIPVKIVSANDPNFDDKRPTTWIPNDVSLISFNIDTTKWIIVNPDQIAFYRVLYDTGLTKLIQEQLERDSSVISPGTRSQLINDYFYFYNEKYLSVESALGMTTYLENETELVVWTAVLSHVQRIFTRFTQDVEALKIFSEYFIPKFEGALNALGWVQLQNEKGAQVIVRAKLLDYACALDHRTCTDYVKSLFDLWQLTPEDRTLIPADLRPIIFCTAISKGTETTWNQALERFNEEKNEMTKSQLYQALACSQEEDGLTRYLEFAYNGVEGFEMTSALQNVARNSVGRTLVYEFLKTNYSSDGVIGPTEFASGIQVLSDYWNQQSDIDDLRAFIEENQDTLDETIEDLRQFISKIEANIGWWNEDGYKIQSWMKSHS